MTSYVFNDKSRPTNDYLNALVWDGQHWQNILTSGNGNVITYFFDNDVTACSDAEKNAYRTALQSWANVANLTFQEVFNESQANVLRCIQDKLAHIWNLGFATVDRFLGYLALGAAIVIPAFIILRLLNSRR